MSTLSCGDEGSWRRHFVIEDSPPERLSRQLLTTIGRFRHAPAPTLSVDSDTGALLIGLTWRR